MAEIFAAVASGAGLVSLTIQLLESAQKLKGFYTTCKDAPQAVADLSFELETMSLSLRQLDTHRRADVLDDQLLARCIMTCTRMNAKIEVAVTKMEGLLRTFRGVGRVYTAFKEPAMRKLLEDLEHAKSSMLFAYMSYCQSWNTREALNRAAEVRLQNALLSSHQKHLQSLDRAVQASHAAIVSQLETSVVQKSTLPSSNNPILPTASKGLSLRNTTKRQTSRTFRFALPHWLTNRVWEFAMQDCEAGWNFQLHPVNIRPHRSFVFDVVRSGNVEAVKKLLASGDLSVSDRESNSWGSSDGSLLSIAASADRLELCEFFLQEFAILRSDAQIHEALSEFLIKCFWISSGFGGFDNLAEAFYELFLSKYGFTPDLNEMAEGRQADPGTTRAIIGEYISSNVLLSERALQIVIASQAVPFDQWPLTQRFCAAIHSRGWPAESFVRLVNFDTITRLAQHKDTRGRTALHWAAEQFGRWMAEGKGRASWNRIRTRRLEYNEFLRKLIVAGADVHALDSANRTPFACMLLISGWSPEHLDNATQVWGDLIQEAGCSLQAYAEHENILLAKLGNVINDIRIPEVRNIWTCQLVIVESSTLAIEVGSSFIVSVWEYRPPPGAWPQNNTQVDKIIWPPDFSHDGNDWYLWQSSKEFMIKRRPVLLCKPGVESTLEQSFALSWRAWITGSQDDHGFVAATLQRGSNLSSQRRPRRRAASLPLPITISHGGIPVPVDESGRFLNTFHWLTEPHRCPLDLSWKSRSQTGPYDYVDEYRRCMQGLCDRPQPKLPVTDHWEAQLLQDEHNFEIARRFTHRFNAEWGVVLKKNHAKAQRLAELGIAVA